MNRKRIYIFIGIIVFCIGIVTFLVLRNKQKTSPVGNFESPIKNTNLEGGSVGNIRYVGGDITSPPTFSVYKNSDIPIDKLASQIASQLGLRPLAGNSVVWLSGDKKSILSIDIVNKLIQFSTSPSLATKPDLNSAKAQANTFVKKFGLGKNISSEPNRIEYLSGGSEVSSTTPDNADIIALYFSQEINGFPVYVDTSTFSDLFVWVGGGNQVVKAIFPQRFTPTISSSNLTGAKFSDIRTSVENKKGSIVGIRIDNRIVNNKVNLGDITLSNADIEYRLDSRSNTFYPFYRFDGLSTIKETRQDVSVTIITPAVAIP